MQPVCAHFVHSFGNDERGLLVPAARWAVVGVVAVLRPEKSPGTWLGLGYANGRAPLGEMVG